MEVSSLIFVEVSLISIPVTPSPTFPILRILPVANLVPHERCDGHRSYLLEERLIADGVLRNPPVVAPMLDELDHYMVLDGANRKNAIQRMGIPHILVQVVLPGAPGLDLKTWNQVVLGITSNELIDLLSDISDLELKMDKEPGLLSDNLADHGVVQVHLPFGEVYNVIARTSNLVRRVEILNNLMNRIGEQARMDRTHLQSIDTLKGLHADLAGLIVFPCFKIEEIISLASARLMIPAGITRFTISPRALRVNYKISDLRADKSLEEKNRDLNAWIQARVGQKGVRSYEEATVMFDE